jgi:plasmid stabilization system protein ParE
MTIEWTSSALENLRDIHSDTAAFSSPAAEAILGKVLDEIDRLSSVPLIGREGRVEDTREFPLLDMPLVVSYRISDKAIQILAILQGAAVPVS